jgi:hypothetical protein
MVSDLQEVPSIIRTHPTVDSFSAFIKGTDDKGERVKIVDRQFRPIRRSGHPDLFEAHDASRWTGVESKVERAKAARTILPVAQNAIETMIEALEKPGHNHGPLLDETQEAIDTLKGLHSVLGELIEAAESGSLEDELGQDLASKAIRWARRLPSQFADDPMPYTSSVLIGSLLAVCGLPTVAGVATSVLLATARPRRG